MRGLLLSPDTGITEIDAPPEALHTVIGPRCDLVERVRTRLTQPHLGNLVLAVDESGLYHDLPVNVLATALYNPSWRVGRPGAIHGNALVFRETHGTDLGREFAPVRDGDLEIVWDFVAGVTV